jgi:putative transposase
MKLRKLDKSQFKELKEQCHIAKNLYNQALYCIKQHYKEHQTFLSYGELDKLMKTVLNLENDCNYRLIWKAGVAQQLLRNLCTNYQTFFKAIQDYNKNPSKYTGKPKSPKYIEKDYYYLTFDNQRFQIKRDKIILNKGFVIDLPKQLRDRKINQIEIYYDYGHFTAIFAYESKETYEKIVANDNVMAIDLGLNNLATCVTNGIIKPFAINGKPLKSINQYYNKQTSKIKSVLKKRNNQHHSKKLEVITQKRKRQINDYLHKASTKIVKQCVDNKISIVIIGNVQTSNNRINLGKKNNQNFVNLSLGQFIQKITYKLEKHDIRIITREESYTSKASFIDNDLMPKTFKDKPVSDFSGMRIKRGMYKTANGILINADVNGAYNILRKETSKFQFSDINCKKGVAGWLHPYKLAI